AIAYMEGVEHRTLVVERPGGLAMIGGTGNTAEAEEGSALGFAVAVEKNSIAAAKIAPHAPVVRMLRARDIAQIIGIRAVGCRNRRIVLLDPPPHFIEERLLERRRIAEHCIGIGILGFEIGAD